MGVTCHIFSRCEAARLRTCHCMLITHRRRACGFVGRACRVPSSRFCERQIHRRCTAAKLARKLPHLWPAAGRDACGPSWRTVRNLSLDGLLHDMVTSWCHGLSQFASRILSTGSTIPLSRMPNKLTSSVISRGVPNGEAASKQSRLGKREYAHYNDTHKHL